MSQPPAYTRQFSFSNYQALNPDDPLPADDLDIELNAVKTTLDAVLTNMALLQRDDGELANDSVGRSQLAPEVDVGFNAPVVWTTATAFVESEDTVFSGSAFYRCLEDHTSGNFLTDLTAGRWELIVDLSDLTIVAAAQIAFTPAGAISSTTVQAAITELDNEKAALSHTHTASQISNSTAAGQAILTAANASAQRTALGLGAMALAASVATANIDSAAVTPVKNSTNTPVQVTQSRYTTNANVAGTTPVDDTIPQIGEGSQILTLTTAAPASSASKFLVEFEGQFTAGAALEFVAALHRVGQNDAIAAKVGRIQADSEYYDMKISYIDSPASASAQTYTVRIGDAAATNIRLNGTKAARRLGGVSGATLTVTEIR
jgi:hypothetical protein